MSPDQKSTLRQRPAGSRTPSKDGEVLDQVRFESGSLLSTSTNSEVELVQSFCELSTSNSIKVRIKNGGQLQLCGSSTSEPVSVAWDYYSNGVIQ